MERKIAIYSNLLLLLTSIHHIYGAYIYDTPWRLHILMFSIPIVAFNLLHLRSILKGKVWLGVFWFLNLFISIGMVGAYEGFYNHLIKVVMYYSGTSEHILQLLFPPPTYEMPNDFFFEFTGVLQAVLLFPLIKFVIMSLKKTFGGKDDQLISNTLAGQNNFKEK